MNNKIRKLLFLSILTLVAAFGASFYSDLKKTPLPVTIEKTEQGIDVKIHDFKVENETNGRKDWILKSDFATINNEQKVVKLENVDMTYFLDDDYKSHISAEKGRINQETRDIVLEGDVRFTAEVGGYIEDYVNRRRSRTSTPKGP